MSDNTHRAVIEYAVPPRIEVIAVGPQMWCEDRLAEHLEMHPVTPYDDDDPGSGGTPLILEVAGP